MRRAYLCSFCNKSGDREEIKNHEKKCSRNPQSKMCDSCSNRVYIDGIVSNSCKLNRIEFIIGTETCSDWSETTKEGERK